MSAKHLTKVVTDESDGKYHWECSCGKIGDPWILKRDAELWAKMHERRPNVSA